MSIQRQSLVRGPGSVSLGTPVFYDKESIEAGLDISRFDVNTSFHGPVDTRLDDVVGRISFTPAGEIASADLAALYPYATPDIGASICGTTDVASIVHSKAGQKVTFHSAALEKMPDLILSAGKTPFGSAGIVSVLKNNAARADANSMYTIAAEAFSDASFASANVKVGKYAAAWSTIFTSIITESGWTISFDVKLKPVQTDDDGTVDYTLESVGVMAKCRPVNLTETNIMDALRVQGTGISRGMTMRQAKDLVVAATGILTFTLKDAALVEGPMRWGASELRAGELGWVGHRAESAGAFGALFTVAAA